jgi:Protein of unknown function (DUF1176)/Invasion associated locus B (IalB) protein
MKQIFAALLTLIVSPALADFTQTPMAPPSQDVIDRALDDPDCFLPETFDVLDMTDTTTLDANTRIHIVPCQVAAYNVISKIIIERRDDEGATSTYDLQSFADYSSLYGWTASDTLTNAFIIPDSGHLAHFHKGRGVGDCGSTGSWEWTGYLFAMVEYRVHEACDQSLMPDAWPIVYQRTSAPEPAMSPDPVIDEEDPSTVAADCSQAPFCEDRRYFKDFLVSCRQPRSDGSRFCSANAYVHDTEAPAGYDYQLRVSRERRDAPLRISLIAVFEMMDRSKPMSISVDEERIAFLEPDKIETPESINDYFVGPQDVTDRLIDAMRAGSDISFTYRSESGKSVNVPFSLSGLTASLLWMQENAGN